MSFCQGIRYIVIVDGGGGMLVINETFKLVNCKFHIDVSSTKPDLVSSNIMASSLI